MCSKRYISDSDPRRPTWVRRRQRVGAHNGHLQHEHSHTCHPLWTRVVWPAPRLGGNLCSGRRPRGPDGADGADRSSAPPEDGGTGGVVPGGRPGQTGDPGHQAGVGHGGRRVVSGT